MPNNLRDLIFFISTGNFRNLLCLSGCLINHYVDSIYIYTEGGKYD